MPRKLAELVFYEANSPLAGVSAAQSALFLIVIVSDVQRLAW